jgi:hypothetical protein
MLMAVTAFQWLMPGPMQFPLVIHQKSTAPRGIFMIGKHHLTAFEGWGKHAQIKPGRHLQHHASSISGLDRLGGLGNRPPARTFTVAPADIARTGWRGRVFFSQILSHFISGSAGLRSKAL